MLKYKLSLFLLLWLSQNIYAQKFFSTDHAYQADVKVAVVEHAYQADLIVYRVEYPYQADLKIYFSENAYQAGWKEKSLKFLLY